MKVAKGVDLESSNNRKKICNYVCWQMLTILIIMIFL